MVQCRLLRLPKPPPLLRLLLQSHLQLNPRLQHQAKPRRQPRRRPKLMLASRNRRLWGRLQLRLWPRLYHCLQVCILRRALIPLLLRLRQRPQVNLHRYLSLPLLVQYIQAQTRLHQLHRLQDQRRRLPLQHLLRLTSLMLQQPPAPIQS